MEKHFGIVLKIDALGVSKYNIDECEKFILKRKDLEENLIALKTVLGTLPFSSHYKNSDISIFENNCIYQDKTC